MAMLKEGVWLHAPLNAFSAIILFKAPAQDDFPQGSWEGEDGNPRKRKEYPCFV